MNVFEHNDYKACINQWIREQKRGGHGQLRQMALYLRVNSVVMSQIFRGQRDLNMEQALGVAKYVGLTEMERDFFLLLVQRARAGTHDLKQVFEQQIEALRLAAQALKNRVKYQKFADEERATFYSHWYYSAIRLGVSIPRLSSLSAIADHLNLDRNLVAGVVEFLLKNKLILQKGDHFELGPQVTHVGHDSPFVKRHHANWRLKALQTMENSTGPSSSLHYTGPMALSEEAAAKIRKLLIELVEKSTRLASQSSSETLSCLCIDWFQVSNSSTR